MTFTVINAEQRSAAWHQARLGRVTGSRAADVLATIKSGEAASRRDYRCDLVVERLTGRPSERGYVSPDMERGIVLEPAAVAAYEGLTGQMVTRSGFLCCDDLMAGCSVDGHAGDGLLEVKCPRSATHLKYLQAGRVPPEYLPQLRHNLWITGAPWIDFVSYDDRFTPDLQVFVVRLEWHDAELLTYEAEVRKFLQEVDRDLEVVNTFRMFKRSAA